ncbi:MAG TPA: glycosyltransferase family 1 protein [Vicinamibacterales bacterium]|nr:glycosyltransferase family 1 protein [Vicinamibacterales bacterium]
MPDRPLVVNATAIGRRPDGITTYGVNLLKALGRAGIDRPMTVVLTGDARGYHLEAALPAHATVRWVTGAMSPARGTRGNLRRWLFANRLAWQHREAVVFGLSQIEAPLVGARSVVMVHDLIPWLFRRAHPRQYCFYRHYLGRAVHHAAAVVTPSRATKADVCRHYGVPPGRVHVIQHGSPVSPRDAPGRHGRGGYILWIGRPEPTKNLTALLDAFQLIQSRTGARLVLAGEGTRAHPSATGLCGEGHGRIRCLGPISEAEKIGLLDGAAVLVCPSLYEGFGFVTLEAMARGCPVVAADTGALPETCGDAALYVDPRQPQAIADALLRVLGCPDVARDLVARGAARVAAFTWQASVRAHVEVFDHVARLSAVGGSGHSRRREVPVEADTVP